MSRIADEVLAILDEMQFDDQSARFASGTGELPRPLYEAVNEVLARLGGKWNGRRRAHLFSFAPGPLVRAVVESGEMPPKNPLAYFPTPKSVVDSLMICADMDDAPDNCKALEPSAGQGAIADRLLRWLGVEPDVVELDPLNVQVLRSKGYDPVVGDFLQFNPGPVYDRIVMNPPFSVDGGKQAWITHVLHAWSLLRDGGVLAAVVPASITFGKDRQHEHLRTLVALHGGVEEIEKGAFKESGTGVSTCIVYASKSSQRWREDGFQGYRSWYSWAAALARDNDRSRYDEYVGLVEQCPDRGDASVEHRLRSFYRRIAEQELLQFNPVLLRERDYVELIECFWEDVEEFDLLCHQA